MWSPQRLSRRPLAAVLGSVGRRFGAGGVQPTVPTVNVEYVFTRAELQPVLQAIRASLAGVQVPLDSPNRLQQAVVTLIGGLGGRGDVVVRRSPAALLTPEYWQIQLTGLDAPTHTALLDIFRTGRA